MSLFDPETYYGFAEIMQRTGCSRSTIERMVRDRRLHPLKFGRSLFLGKELNSAAENGRTKKSQNP